MFEKQRKIYYRGGVILSILLSFSVVGCFGSSTEEDEIDGETLGLLALLSANRPTTSTIYINNQSGGTESYALHTASGCTDTPKYTFTPTSVANGSKTDKITITPGYYYISYNTPRSSNCLSGSFSLTSAGKSYYCNSGSTAMYCYQ